MVPVYSADAIIWLDVLEIGPVYASPNPNSNSAPVDPDALMQHLFADIAPDPDEKLAWGTETPPAIATYALLDAAILPQLPEMLESSGLEHRCLFTGKALEDLGGAAPWLVRLEHDHRLSRKLIRAQDDGGFRDMYLGIFLRSRQPLDALWRHLRKFTRVQDDAGQWFFNRFWSAPVSTGLLNVGNSADLTQFVAPLFPEGRDALRIVTLSPFGCTVLSRIPGTRPPTARPVLTAAVQMWMRHLRRVFQFEELIAIALRHVAKTRPIEPLAMAAHLRRHRDQFFEVGFWRRDHLTMLCVWEIMLGPDFIDTYGEGHIRHILMTSAQDWEAIQRISDYLEPPDEPTEAEIIAQLHAAELARKVLKTNL